MKEAPKDRRPRPRSPLEELWREFRAEASGMAGLALLVLFLAAAVLEPLLLPFPEANARWHDITYWEDNPKNAPPAWTNWFAARKAAPSAVVRVSTRSSEQSGSARLEKYVFDYPYRWEIPPSDVIVRLTATGTVPLVVGIRRPDGTQMDLVQEQVAAGERQGVRISVAQDASDAVLGFLQGLGPSASGAAAGPGGIGNTRVLFSRAAPDMLENPRPLEGTYTVTLTAILVDTNARVENPYLVVSGMVSGILGTDSSKRDLWSGVVAGVKWALLIGILTALVAVGVGVVFGITSAYFSGITDALMQRVFEVFVNTPLLPILIVLSAVFKPSIWFLILMMSAFFWVGPVKTVRSMALQIKEETYIEASRALGAGSGRIIFRHMVPLLVPYSFASMALYVPSAVVYEATVSLLGLGDATIVTWGQILHDALTGSAVLNGLWWWVVPPGLMIAAMGMTFSFIGFAMDTILQPKLRTR